MRGMRFLFSKKQDAIVYYEQKLEKVNSDIEGMKSLSFSFFLVMFLMVFTECKKKVFQDRPKRDIQLHPHTAGFVTFRSMADAYLAASFSCGVSLTKLHLFMRTKRVEQR